jgi:peroxiredoxin
VPWVRAWHTRFGPKGLVVIGVHTPETAAERAFANVAAHVKKLGIRHAVALDNDFAVWRAFGVRAWPTVFLIDRRGHIRHRFEGELGWWATRRGVAFDRLIGELLAER